VSWEAVTALASAATSVVVAATAVAALVQLRHLRQSNQLEALLTILRMPYDHVLNDAFNFCHHDLQERLKDPEFLPSLDIVPVDRQVHKELWVLDYYERIGSYMKYCLIEPEVYLDSSSPERYWNLTKPVVKRLRARSGPYVYENFEYLVALARPWDERHPDGN